MVRWLFISSTTLADLILYISKNVKNAANWEAFFGKFGGFEQRCDAVLIYTKLTVKESCKNIHG